MGLGDWYQERKEKKAAKKEAARLAAGQARQAAEEEKKRQQEAQAQQAMGYTRNYIQMLERMQGAGDRKGYQNLAAMREQLVQGMGNSPHAQILTDALNFSMKAANERISRAEKQEGHKETIRKERKTPLETLIRKEQTMTDGQKFKPEGEAAAAGTDLNQEEKLKESKGKIAKNKFKNLPGAVWEAVKDAFSDWKTGLNTVYDKLTGTMDVGAGSSGIGGDSSDIQDMEKVMKEMTDADTGGAGITGAVFSGVSTILKCVKTGITIVGAIKNERDNKTEITLDKQERFQVVRGLLHDIVEIINGFGTVFGPATKMIPFYNSILGIVSNSAAVLADVTDVVANSVFHHNMRKRCKMLYQNMVDKKTKYEKSGDTTAAQAYTVRNKSSAIDKQRRNLLGKIAKENQGDDSVGGKIRIVKAASLRSRNDTIYREAQYGVGARIQALDEKIHGQGSISPEERTRLKTQKRELEAMETMEQYREADKAQKKMGKALLHNVESVITGGTNVVANGLKLAGEIASATGVGVMAGAGLYTAGMATGIAEGSYELARGGGSLIYKSIRYMAGTSDNKATTREDMAISLIERMHEVGTSAVWDAAAGGFKDDRGLDQVEAHQLARQGKNVDHLHGILRSGLDATMTELIGSKDRTELKENIASAFGQAD